MTPRVAARWVMLGMVVVLFTTVLIVVVARTQMGLNARSECARAGRVWVDPNYNDETGPAVFTGCITPEQAQTLRLHPKKK